MNAQQVAPKADSSAHDAFTVTCFKNAKTKSLKNNTTAPAVIDQIRDGKWREQASEIQETYQQAIQQGLGAKGAKEAVRALKEKLPGVTFSGAFSERKAESLTSYSGTLCADLDGLGSELGSVRAKLLESPHLRSVFTSPSGTGLKALFDVVPDPSLHAQNFQAAKAHLVDLFGQEFVDRHLDEGCKDIGRLCFVSHDPLAVWNWKAETLAFEKGKVIYSSEQAEQTEQLNKLNKLHGTSPLHGTTRKVSAREALERMKSEKIAESVLPTLFASEESGLLRLYKKLVEKKFTAAAGERNEFIKKSVPFLYRALAPDVVLRFVGVFYDCHKALFNDPRDRHMYEASKMLESVAQTYLSSLHPDLREIYNGLENEHERDTFRILGDLAAHDNEKYDPGTFFMSANNLAYRVGVEEKMGWRLLIKFGDGRREKVKDGYKFIRIIEKGLINLPRENKRPRATHYEWMINETPPQVAWNQEQPDSQDCQAPQSANSKLPLPELISDSSTTTAPEMIENEDTTEGNAAGQDVVPDSATDSFAPVDQAAECGRDGILKHEVEIDDLINTESIFPAFPCLPPRSEMSVVEVAKQFGSAACKFGKEWHKNHSKAERWLSESWKIAFLKDLKLELRSIGQNPANIIQLPHAQ